MILHLYAKRHFLIQGDRTLLVSGMRQDWIRRRMKATLDFASQPDLSNLENLKTATSHTLSLAKFE